MIGHKRTCPLAAFYFAFLTRVGHSHLADTQFTVILCGPTCLPAAPELIDLRPADFQPGNISITSDTHASLCMPNDAFGAS